MVNRLTGRVLFLFLNTGGGHRSTAYAVAEAIRDLYGDHVHTDLVDVTTEYFPWPASRLDALYNRLVRLNAWPWAVVYHLTSGVRRIALLNHAWHLLTGTSILNVLDDHPADVIVCCHPLLKAPIARALTTEGLETQLITLVTDLVSGHASWFVPGGDRYLVATEQARECALACGVPMESVEVTGLPVRPCFVSAAERNPVSARRNLELDPTIPVVLLVSGADGVGPLVELVTALVNSGVKAQLAVITGSNKKLYERLESHTWSLPLRTERFVTDLHQWMRAADLLVTKAGPSTLSEALVMGLPMILSGALPGQERPNVDYIVDSGAGVWAPTPMQTAEIVRELLDSDGQSLARMRRSAQALAQPDAARRAAQSIWNSTRGTLA